MRNLFATILTTYVVATDDEENLGRHKKTCRALALSGGANNGAWEAGVLYGLANYGNPKDYYYDVVTGVSAGAINSAFIAVYEPKDVIEMADNLFKAWMECHTSKIWQYWPGGLIAGLLKPGLLDDSPGL
jgi:predicted acylesterase/phospholipase RssA